MARRGWRTAAAALAGTATVALLGALAATSGASPGPNLQVSQVSATLSADQTSIGVGFLITNTGDATAPAFNWAVYLSTDTLLSADDAQLRNKAAGSLDPGKTVSGPTNVLVPGGTPAGHYCVIVQAPTGAPGTGSTGSACFDLGASPNLVVDAVTAPASSPPAGGPATLGATVHNVGSGAAGASHVGFYLSTDATFGGDTLLGQASVGTLSPAATAQVSASVTLPALTPGTYTIFAVADSAQEVTESNESDNARGAAMLVSSPNLVPNLLSAPTTVPGVGGSVDVTFTIRNVGNVDAGASHWAIWLSNDTTLSPGEDSKIHEGSVSPIAGSGGASSHITSSVPLPNVVAGPRCILIQADSQSEVAESDENDNVVAACLTIEQAIDLTSTISGVPATVPIGGAAVTPTVTVANGGNTDSGASALGLYLSSDANYDGADTQLATVPVASVPAFSSVQVQPTLTLPALPLGRYYVLAVADAGGAVGETDETNNVVAAAFDVQAPNLVVQVLQGAVDTPQDGSVPVTFAIKNVGSAAAPGSDYSVWLSDDAVLGGDTLLRAASVSALAANASSTTIQTSLQLPPGTTAGPHCLLFQADSGAAVTESSETDNVASSCFTALLVDHVPPVSAAAVDAPATLSGWNTAAVTVHLTATDDKAGVKEIHWVVGGHETVVPGAAADVPVAGDGETTVTWFAVDLKDNVESQHTVVAKVDTHAPSLTCSPPGPGWHAADVSVPCTAADPASGLANPTADASFSLSTAVAPGHEDAAGPTGLRPVCDVAGNCATAGPFTAKVDRRAPELTCPADDGQWHGGDVSYACTAADGGSGLAQAGDASFSLSTSVPANTETASAQTGSKQVCDAVGNCATAGPLSAKVDRKAPTFTCAQPDSAWHGSNVEVACTATDGGVGPAAASFTLSTSVAPGGEDASASTGTHEVCDLLGNCVTAPALTAKVDRKAPAIACTPPAAGWRTTDVTVPCTASDTGAGIAPADASFTLSTSVAAGSEDAAAQTGTRHVCDLAGNCADAGPYAFQVDRAAPQVSCAAPDALPWHAGDVTFTCIVADGGSGPAEPSFTLSTSLPAGQEDAAAPTGSHQACDLVGNCAPPTSRTAGVDKKAPTVTCPAADSAWHRTEVSFDCAVSDGGSGAPGPVTLTATAPVNAETTGSTGSAQACDAVGNCSPAGPIGGVKFDTKAPSFSCDQPDSAWHGGSVSLVCTGADGGSGVAGAGTVTLTASVAPGVEDASAFTGAGQLCDVAGNCVAVPALGPVKLDRKAPTVICPAPDSAWHAANVGFTCTAADGGSGPASAQLQLATSVPAGSESANASTGTAQACDAAGNCATAGPIAGVRVDRKAPTVAIARPAGAYVFGQAVTASYTCTDGGSGVAGCTGPVASGAAVDTEDLGSHTFAVTATDAAGNTATASTTYSVAYGSCVPDHVPPGPVGGKTIRVWVIVCDADGNDVSTKRTELRAVDVDGDSLPKLPGDRKFHREPFGYRYDLDGSKLDPGTHVLRFTVSGDATLHSVAFTVPKSKPKPKSDKRDD